MKKPFVIVISHQKGGVGKSTVAANIAVELSKQYTLNVVDLDTQKSLSYFNSLRKKAKLKEFNIINIISANDLKATINKNKEVLLIDVGGFDSDLNRIAMLGADLIITPVSDSGIELVGLLAFRNILRDIREHRKDLISHVLLNRIHPSATISLNTIYDFIKTNPEFVSIKSILRDRVEYKTAFDSGKSVIELKGKAVSEMKNLIKEITHG
jgi:chromosome partitioning protein